MASCEGREVLIFKRKDALKVASRLGYEISENGKIKENNSPVMCFSCGEELTKDNLGVIAPGSRIPFCNNPACYTKYLAEKSEKA